MANSELVKLSNQSIDGFQAEHLFLEWLAKHGWQLVIYNWRSNRSGAGQVDVIAKGKKVALFEVKYRSCQTELNWPLTMRQLRRLYRASLVWNASYPYCQISELYLVLMRPIGNLSVKELEEKLNQAISLKHINVRWGDYLIQFFSFRDILD
ncbi:YraN family protein [Amygdalobacter nucleatus]|uniref:Uncharacterized protein n=1 Tax=Amygdalobacter nucleatus TaxID=3029274 RepID=A0A133Y6E6_9FIRM|nr:YraN family protein [Amygdalobacter nucleatus]KXB38779.1 hypothetical protein HMPREF1872_01502 [Amygdalobacter nucleatus]MDF0485921.1 YraN family protein [Amygdalobacter nucleatus]WEG36259.1 YraN family protein [Amygdalobacter nucleatus]